MTFNLAEVLVLILINTFSVFLIIVVLANSAKEKLFRWFVMMTICLIGWVDFAYIGYLEPDLKIALIAYRINLAFVAEFFFAIYMFYVECFLKINKKLFRQILLIISIIFIFLSLFTNTIIKSLIRRDWGNEITFGPANDLFNLFSIAVTAILIYYFYKKYFELSIEEKRKVIYFLVGTFFLITFNVIFNVLSPVFLGTAQYQHLGDYSAVIFLAFTAFAMLKHSFLNVRVALTAFLISVISILLLIDIIALSNSLSEQGVKVVIFVFFVGVSILLMRSVLNEIKQKEQLAKINIELDKSRQKYIDLASEQKDVIDVMGHEIRTPLSIVKQEINYHKATTFLEVGNWKKGKVNPEQVTEFFAAVETIDEEVDHTLRLVTDMLEAARIDKQRFELSVSEFDIVAMSKKLFNSMLKADGASKFEFEFKDNALETLIVKADETRIRESIDALLTNAIKYGKNIEGMQSRIEMELRKDDKNVYISLKDNGRGIDPADIEKLGKKFVRLQPKTANLERPGGTGLGLFVVKNIMNYHKGDLVIKSEGIGKGSTFELILPLGTTSQM